MLHISKKKTKLCVLHFEPSETIYSKGTVGQDGRGRLLFVQNLENFVVGDEPEVAADGGVAKGAVSSHVGADLVEIGRVRAAEFVVDD